MISVPVIFSNPFLYLDAIGEAIVSVYPFIVKTTDLDIPLQTAIRLGTYSMISILLANWSVLLSVPVWQLLSIAVINIIHILTSYYGFHYLNPSLAQSIFYIFPFLNLVFNIIFMGESIAATKFVMLIPILLTVYFIYRVNEIEPYTGIKSEQNVRLGIPMIIGAMITESLLYIFIKMSSIGVNPWNNVLVTYALAGIVYTVYWLIANRNTAKETWKNNKGKISRLILMNILIGSFGYGLRFASITQVPSVVYSALSYTGIFMAVVYGLYFQVETMSHTKIGALIALFVWLIAFQFI
jgi:drug/metabolite transporter (DMT)-like permease